MQNSETLVKPSAESSPKIRKSDIFRVFLRSFFMQSVWNYRSLISFGFGMCLIPVMQRLCKNEKEKSAFLARHFKFFNAHPYLASYALGVSIHLEEAFAAGDPQACQKLERFKQLLISILGAMGDKLFWSTIKPASLVFGVMGVLLFDTFAADVVWLIITFLLYNTPHLYLRYQGIWEGYQLGIDVYKKLNEERYRGLFRFYYVLGTLSLIGVMLLLMTKYFMWDQHALLAFSSLTGFTLVVFNIYKRFYLTVGAGFVFAVLISLLN
jgi:mannose/fructose/N-acetylgalactosamine-specific phosphotransferase system component IID